MVGCGHTESLLDEQHDAVDGAQPSSMIALLGERPHAAALPLAAAATSPRPQLSWHFVRCDVQQWDGHTKTLLLDVCGVAGGASGTGLFALMGPSGSGKSTLLDVLSGRSVRGHVTGSIRLDGVVTTKATRRSICGYVLQDEVLPGKRFNSETLRPP
jgi:ABC-type transport system involved in cytochrome bd biosynthesis fused ATPase/permease subunit